jgi:hypothetical protein
MTVSGNVSLLDLFDLSDAQRELFLWLARYGPADASALAQPAGLDPAEAQEALEALIQQGRVRWLVDGRVDAISGRVRSRTTLPAELWQTLLATDRHYSEQDIATFRTAIPILQLARARLAEYVDHGPGHALRVKSFAAQMGSLVGLSEVEHGLLRWAALFHDVGNIVERGQHHVLSQETVLRLTAEGALPFTAEEAEVVGVLCRWHRREYEPGRSDEVNGRAVRTGLLASILRVADAMDIDHRRSDYVARWSDVILFFFPEEGPHWAGVRAISGLRIRCTPAVELEVYHLGDAQDNIQIDSLRRDLASTPFPWTLRQIPVSEGQSEGTCRPGGAPGEGCALLAFPFEPHSVVMAARRDVAHGLIVAVGVGRHI